MYYLIKNLEISSAHCLRLDYDSKCKNIHGHNWNIIIFCKNKELNHNGMVIDFNDIKEIVMQLDHDNINNYIEQPTAENIAKYLCEKIPFCYKVKVVESKNNIVIYEKV